MQRYVNALVWQCSITEPNIFERSDSILPLSRYVKIYINRHLIEYYVRNIQLQTLVLYPYYPERNKITCHSGYESYINIWYFSDYTNCYAVTVVLQLRTTSIAYTWHWNGRLSIVRIRDIVQSQHHKHTAECLQKNNRAIFDKFISGFLHFRRIRIRKTES